MTILVGFIVMSHQTYAQQETWNKKYRFGKSFKEAGSVFSLIKVIDKEDSLSFYGYFDAYLIFNEKTGQIIQQGFDSNSMKKNGAIYQSAGKIRFTHSHSAVYTHKKMYNNEYVGIENTDSAYIGTGFYSAIYVLDKLNNTYKGVWDLEFDGLVSGIYPIGNSKAVIWGDFLHVKSKSGTFRAVRFALWDLSNNTVQKIPYASDPTSFGIYGGYPFHSISKSDGTVLISTEQTIKFILSNSDPITNSIGPFFATSGRYMSCAISDKNHMYVAWQKDSLTWPIYLLKVGIDGSTQKMARFTNPNANWSYENWINGMAYDEKTGEFIFSGTFKEVNGKPFNNIVKWNDQTRIFTNLPPPPFIKESDGGMDRSRVEVVDGQIFLIEDNDNLIFGQNIYVLSDITPPVPPVVKSFVGEDADTVINISGTAEPKSIVTILIENTTNNTVVSLTSVTSNESGIWSFYKEDLPEGKYRVTITSKDASGNISVKTIFTFERKKVVSVITAVNSGIETEIMAYPNPASKSVFLKDAKRILKVSGIQGNTLFPNFSISFDGVEVDVGEFQNGLYIIECENSLNKKQVLKVLVLK